MYHSTLCITVAKILKTVKLLYSSSVSLLKWILLLYSMCEVVKVCKFFFTTNLTNVDSMWSYSVVRRLFVFPRWALWFFKNDKSKTWQANLRLISKFDTVEDFWAYVFVTCWVHATQYHRLKCKARIIVWMGFWFLFFLSKNVDDNSCLCWCVSMKFKLAYSLRRGCMYSYAMLIILSLEKSMPILKL